MLVSKHTDEPASRSVTRATCYSNTHFLQTQGPTYNPAKPKKKTFSHSDGLTSATIKNFRCRFFKRSFVIYLQCQLIHSALETNNLNTKVLM